MPVNGTPTLSWMASTALLVYIGLTFTIGGAFYRKASNAEDYFVSSRQIPLLLVVVGLAAALS